MINFTTALWRHVSSPPAHVVQVNDSGVSRIDLPDDQPPFVGVILELQNTERIGGPFNMLFRIGDDQARELVNQLSAVLYSIDADGVDPLDIDPMGGAHP